MIIKTEKHVPLAWIDGPIAVGKTTTAEKICERLGWQYLKERFQDNRLVDEFYKDEKRWAFAFQMQMLFKRARSKNYAEAAIMASMVKGIALDRSIAGDKVFARVNHELGNINDHEMAIYEDAFDYLARGIRAPTVLVYIDAQPATMMRRLKARGRDCETKVSLEYLTQLRDGYERMLDELESGRSPWGSHVRIERIVGDVDTISEDCWDGTAETIRRFCERR